MNASTALRRLSRSSRLGLRRYHAPVRIQQPILATQRNLSTRPQASYALRKRFPSGSIANQIRRGSSQTGERPLTDRPVEAKEDSSTESEDIAARKAQEPAYELTFTCRKCMDRSSHRITKQAYHFGTTLITCPGCKNRHLISDHLKIFSDKGITLEDILKEKGQFLKKGRLGEDGDIEFYDETNNEIGRAQAKAEAQEKV